MVGTGPGSCPVLGFSVELWVLLPYWLFTSEYMFDVERLTFHA